MQPDLLPNEPSRASPRGHWLNSSSSTSIARFAIAAVRTRNWRSSAALAKGGSALRRHPIDELVLSDDFVPFLTLIAYPRLVGR
jgi:hypothetical protein